MEIGDDQIHVWSVDLNPPQSEIDVIADLLSADEKRRIDRLVSAEARRRFLVCRGRVRQVLASYLSGSGSAVLPVKIDFQYQALGKPYIPGAALRFSVSHSADLALLAISKSRDLGVDLEQIRNDVGAERIVSRFFSQEQRREFEDAPEEVRLNSFFRIWTRREACLKARGLGVGGADGAENLGLTLHEWSPKSGFLAALAWEGPGMGVINYHFDNTEK